ncbi:MAG: SufS family cysteine desulfurase [Deltaproteobacteria bacterium]|nr:SufS family cysteine desulfurase [Deltaproteobacteria bacterium]
MDLTARRRAFPALDQRAHGQRLAYLDAAATSLQPRVVIDAVVDAALHAAGNPGRGVHLLAEAASVALDDARHEVARFLGADADEVVFTSGTTASINLVADAWGRANLGPGDAVIATELEHHSNLVPWQRLCAERGAELRIAPVDEDGRIDLAALDALLDSKVKLVAVAHVSNVLGTIAPVAAIAARAHAVGARVLVDGAQAVAHLEIDVRALGCDFYAFSGHKLYGPPGTGVLWARRAILDAMPPWQVGGGMVARVDRAHARYREPPYRFEAGTPNTTGLIGLGAAIRFVRSLDRAAVAADEARVHAAIARAVQAADGTILGRPEVGVVSFALGRVHPHDVATIADQAGVALRSGHHCAEPIHHRHGVDASTRASIGCYSDDDDVAQLARALARVREVFG